MHEAALARAAIPSPCVVLGMLLRPLSLGHIMALSRDDTLLSASAGSLTAAQLTAAVLVCCQSWESYAGIANDRLLPVKLWIWRQRVKSAAKRHAKRQSSKIWSDGYFKSESKRFIEYISEGSLEFPPSDAPRPDRPSASRQPGAPFILRMHQWLMVSMRLNEAQAWDYPFGLAKMRWECYWEGEGGFDILNEADDTFTKFAAENDRLEALELAKREPTTHHG